MALPVIGGFAALGIEYVYLREVQLELDGVSAAASQAAMVGVRQRGGTTGAARALAVQVVEGSTVAGSRYTLDPADVQFGHYDGVDFTVSEDTSWINAVRVPLTLDHVGLGFGTAFFGRDNSVRTCSAVAMGPGDANDGTNGGPGLANGHFDLDTTDARRLCPGSTRCTSTTKHTHQFDDQYDTTYVDLFHPTSVHLAVDGCTDSSGKVGPCDATHTRTVPDGVPFKVILLNADLSPGAWLTLNGIDYDVTEYDDIPFADLPTYTLGSGLTRLWQLQMNFDVEAIANCELIPTNTPVVRANIPGIYGEWRSGALTVQLVSPTATPTAGTSSGTHQAVIDQSDGLLWESTYFWHWGGPDYTAADAVAWQAAYDALPCPQVVYIEDSPGGAVCP